ncbi:MAG TPA: hypothetical protein VD929_01915 [Caulobacteraceae bacterium]|nr:hypothetical protein [Caulobacteraceae bacterium]
MTDSVADRLTAARGKLQPPSRARASALGALAAAALAATSALTLAAAVILGPGVEAPAVQQR